MIKIIVRSILYWVIFIALFYLTSNIFLRFSPPEWTRLSYGILGILSAYFTTWIFLKFDNQNFTDIGLTWQHNTIIKFVKGLLLGMGIFAIILLVLVNFTELQITLNPKGINLPTALGFLAIFPLALMEELAFRAYPLVILNRKFGLWITQFIVAIAFALYHIQFGWSAFSAFSGPFVWAFVFGLAAVWSGGIALPTGIHVALNILQPLSGMKGEEYSLFSLNYNEVTPAKLIERTDTVGILIQAAVLAAALICTAYYIRKFGKKGIVIE
jgi:membrane protease YdiL (CAAX protease family)